MQMYYAAALSKHCWESAQYLDDDDDDDDRRAYYFKTLATQDD